MAAMGATPGADNNAFASPDTTVYKASESPPGTCEAHILDSVSGSMANIGSQVGKVAL